MSNASGRSRRRLPIVIGVALVALSATAVPCGLEDPTSISFLRGTLNLAYPESLHVGTAMWQAQLAGTLPRDALSQRADLSPEARGKLRLFKANGLLRQLATRLGDTPDAAAHPKLAIVLLGPVMWSRFEQQDGAVRVTVHVAGPVEGDVVVVTDLAAIEAIVNGDLGFAEAFDLGVMRLYGPATDIVATRTWLSHLARG